MRNQISFATIASMPTSSKKVATGWSLPFAAVAFIVVSLVAYLPLGTAAAVILVFADGLSGLTLPLGLTVFMYIFWFRPELFGGIPHPKRLPGLGSPATILAWHMAVVSIVPILNSSLAGGDHGHH